jgi:hypothetical protein
MHKGCIHRQLVISTVLGTLLTECISWQSLGIRPDLPGANPSDPAKSGCQTKHQPNTREHEACLDFYTIHAWSNALEEAYRSRATFNEWSIYFAGTIALATISTTAALATVHTAQETLALLPIAGDFSSGFFGLLDNKSRGAAYTVAANEIATARATAVNEVALAGAAAGTQGENGAARNKSGTGQQDALLAAYYKAAGNLYKAVTDARNELETKRKEQLASAAQERLTTKVQSLQQQLDDMQDKLALQNALITMFDPPAVRPGDLVTMTINDIDLQRFPPSDLKVIVDNALPLGLEGMERDAASGGYFVKFKAPAEPESKSADGYSVMLRAKNQLIRSWPDLHLQYKAPT